VIDGDGPNGGPHSIPHCPCRHARERHFVSSATAPGGAQLCCLDCNAAWLAAQGGEAVRERMQRRTPFTGLFGKLARNPLVVGAVAGLATSVVQAVIQAVEDDQPDDEPDEPPDDGGTVHPDEPPDDGGTVQ
jgi:hypothetical protein